MKKHQFIKKEVAEILGIRPSQVQYYTDQGVITPDINAPKGRGTRRVYSVRNLLEILITKRMVEHGISIEDAIEVIKGLRQMDENMEPEYRDVYWDIETWGDGQSLFLIYRVDFDSAVEARVAYYNDRDNMKRALEDTITHKTKSMHIINLTDIAEKLRLK